MWIDATLGMSVVNIRCFCLFALAMCRVAPMYVHGPVVFGAGSRNGHAQSKRLICWHDVAAGAHVAVPTVPAPAAATQC